MDPLLIAAYSSTTFGPASKARKAEEAFYDRHGGQGLLRRAFPVASAVAVTVAVVVAAGLLGQ